MSYRPDPTQHYPLVYEVASLYGMPHLGVMYYRDDIDATRWTGETRCCAACGKSTGFHSKHHEPPRSASRAKVPGRKGVKRGAFLLDASKNPGWEPQDAPRSFLLRTDWGQFVLFPALIDLCGTGTTGCHGDRHNGKLSIRWEWDCDEHAEKWWSGWFLSHGYAPHDPKLFEFGRYVFSSGEGEWEVRR